MLDALFLYIIIVARRLNIGLGYPFLARSKLLFIAFYILGLLETGEYLGAIVTGIDIEANNDLDLIDFDELNILFVLDLSYSDIFFDLEIEDAYS
jgi:hypothetical protein